MHKPTEMWFNEKQHTKIKLSSNRRREIFLLLFVLFFFFINENENGEKFYLFLALLKFSRWCARYRGWIKINLRLVTYDQLFASSASYFFCAKNKIKPVCGGFWCGKWRWEHFLWTHRMLQDCCLICDDVACKAHLMDEHVKRLNWCCFIFILACHRQISRYIIRRDIP